MAQLLLFIFCCTEHAKYLPCLPYFFMIQSPLSSLQLSDPVAEIRSNLHVQILPGLLDYSEKKISFLSVNWENRQKRKVTDLYKIFLFGAG